MIIYMARKAQITLLVTKKIAILAEYSDFINLYLQKSAVEASKH